MENKVAFIISCYSKIDDLMVHLEILKYCPFDHEIIVVTMMDMPEEYEKELEKYHHIKINSFGHSLGPLLSSVAGIRKCHELGIKYAVYRNSDDWLFNYDFEKENFQKMEKEGYICAGYNWLTVDTFHEITLNQLYFDVEHFYENIEDAEKYFLSSHKGLLCEYKMIRWVKKSINGDTSKFYRLPDREQHPGIGWERSEILKAFALKRMSVPVGFWEKLENNNRFFNLKWQLIGSHENGTRLYYWNKIKKLIPYGKEVEKEPHFQRFLSIAPKDQGWNLEVEKTLPEPKPKEEPAKVFKRKIF